MSMDRKQKRILRQYMCYMLSINNHREAERLGMMLFNNKHRRKSNGQPVEVTDPNGKTVIYDSVYEVSMEFSVSRDVVYYRMKDGPSANGRLKGYTIRKARGKRANNRPD